MFSVVLLSIGVGIAAGGVGTFLMVVAGIHKEPPEMHSEAPYGTVSVARKLLGVSVVRPSGEQ